MPQSLLDRLERFGLRHGVPVAYCDDFGHGENHAILPIGRPAGFTITIRDLRLSNGAGFVVAYAGDVMTMPGLPKVPAAEKIDVGADNVIHGLF